MREIMLVAIVALTSIVVSTGLATATHAVLYATESRVMHEVNANSGLDWMSRSNNAE